MKWGPIKWKISEQHCRKGFISRTLFCVCVCVCGHVLLSKLDCLLGVSVEQDLEMLSRLRNTA